MNKDKMKRKIETSKLTNEEINIKNYILSDIFAKVIYFNSNKTVLETPRTWFA